MDGNSTTWEYLRYESHPDEIEDWEQDVSRRRRHLARQDLQILIPDYSVPLYDYPTYEAAHALKQKQKRSKKESLTRYSDWDAITGSRTKGSRAYDQHSQASLDVGDASFHEVECFPPQVRLSNWRASSPSVNKKRKINVLQPTEVLGFVWSAVCKDDGAAGVTIVNDIEPSPPLVPAGFQYIENKYWLGGGVIPPDPGFLATCDCETTCGDTQACECQDSNSTDYHGRKTCAYDDKGFFKFDRAGVIIECNINCSCSDVCQNKVTQRPRKVPIQIFLTLGCGWGVRSTVALSRGEFIGIYAGTLIRREEADEAIGERKSYIFDLDAMETVEDVDDLQRYSVDAYEQGNWSRFINHSCEPNMEVLSVVWDTPLSMNRPYLAFFATKVIPALTELTIDYDPRAARHINTHSKRDMDNGDKVCMCGTALCRGYISV